MKERKTLSKEELENIAGGWHHITSWEKPSVCPVCKSQLIDHPNGIDINGHPVLVCKKNVWNKDHWVLWGRRR